MSEGVRLAIMQPYLFPYVGYWQLMAAVDRFVIYDDVQFMKSGWINRNSLRVNGDRWLFTLPLHGASPNVTIREVLVAERGFARWFKKFRRTLQQAYAKAAHRDLGLALVDRVLADAAGRSIDEVNRQALLAVRDALSLPTEIVDTSAAYGNDTLRAQTRVLDICRRERAATYVNAIGGVELYDEESFAAKGLALRFLQPELTPYSQLGEGFTPSLSVLDLLMNEGPEGAKAIIGGGRLMTRSEARS